MFKNYLKVAFRSLNRNRVYALINILGLAMGLTISILVFLFVTDEMSYDKNWSDYDKIYRTGIKVNMMGQKMDGPAAPSPMAQALRTEFSEIESATRIYSRTNETLVSQGETKLYVKNTVFADSAFFKVFEYEFVHGNPFTALKEQNAIVLNEKTAEKLFGDKNAMGEIIKFDNERDLIVKGIVKTPPGRAHFNFNMFISYNDIELNNWLSHNQMTYLRLRAGIEATYFLDVMTTNFMKKIEPNIEQVLKITIDEFHKRKNSFEYTLQPIEKIHLHSNSSFEIEQNGNITYIYVFIGIALLVILIAGINFMNLSTARSGKRAKEVGVRKVTGASRKMLIFQFLIESLIQSLIALLIAFIFVELFLTGFNNIMETDLVLFNNSFLTTLLFALIITIVYGLFAGSYPAFFLSGFKPVSVLKGDLTKTKGGTLLRKTLVVVQFTASIILIIGMIIIFKQISFLHNKDVGFKGEQVIIVPIQSNNLLDNFNNYKGLFLKNKNVLSLSRAAYFPGDTPYNDVFLLEGREEQMPLWYLDIDYDFFETLDVKLLEGRKFDREKESDSIAYYILNETAVKNLNIENAVGRKLGQYINRDGGVAYGNIIGIVKDFHIEGFNQPVRPMVLRILPRQQNVAIKITPNDMNATIDFVENQWNKLEPAHVFRYSFLDQRFKELLRQQENFGTMFLFLTILAIIISSMGLYGLASYTAEQRTKEIGVRKVLGASVSQIMKMLTIDFMKLVLIANIFAWPITYILAKDWLSNFSYQIEIPIMPYILATLLALIIALVTVSSQAYQAANSDPVNALKYE